MDVSGNKATSKMEEEDKVSGRTGGRKQHQVRRRRSSSQVLRTGSRQHQEEEEKVSGRTGGKNKAKQNKLLELADID